MDNIYYTKYLIDNNYDGIIHIKSSFCTPEIGSMGIINKMCEEANMPILFITMDTNTSKVGIETRLEAFFDMISCIRDNIEHLMKPLPDIFQIIHHIGVSFFFGDTSIP